MNDYATAKIVNSSYQIIVSSNQINDFRNISIFVYANDRMFSKADNKKIGAFIDSINSGAGFNILFNEICRMLVDNEEYDKLTFFLEKKQHSDSDNANKVYHVVEMEYYLEFAPLIEKFYNSIDPQEAVESEGEGIREFSASTDGGDL